eukprot:TRINITY_DN2688_c0_g1_i1.p1 TRINITY_DN2688_c0_g1~~TRINITY_DN2688_c0_g1_i1.p1  ORF type:complete len:295 (+),score=57.80 TRINITY_DN2688_c0_g1_i1:25-885(+)
MGLDLSEEETEITRILIGVASSLSLIGSLFTVISFLTLDSLELKSMPFRMALMLSISNLCCAACALLIAIAGYDTLPNEICWAQTAVLQYFTLATFCWIFCISCTVYLVVVRKSVDVDNYFPYFMAGSWLLPLVLDTILLVGKHVGSAGYWCTRDKGDSSDFTRITLYYGPMVLACFVNFVLGIATVRELHNDRNTQKTVFRSRIWKRTMFVMLAFLVCFMWSLMERLYSFFNPNVQFVLFVLQATFVPLFGFATSLIYGINARTLKLWSQRIFSGDTGEIGRAHV